MVAFSWLRLIWLMKDFVEVAAQDDKPDFVQFYRNRGKNLEDLADLNATVKAMVNDTRRGFE